MDEVKKELANRWEFTMNVIWSFFKKCSEWDPKVRFSKIEDSIIIFQLGEGLTYVVKCFFINNKYLQLEITADEEPDFVASITHVNKMGEKEIIQILSSILTHCEIIKP